MHFTEMEAIIFKYRKSYAKGRFFLRPSHSKFPRTYFSFLNMIITFEKEMRKIFIVTKIIHYFRQIGGGDDGWGLFLVF